MPSTPLFSIRQLDIILISGSIVGIYLCGLTIGEQLQVMQKFYLIVIAVCMSAYFLWFITVRTLYYAEVKAK